MKIAVLMQCHKNAKQIRALLKSFQHPDVHVFVHIDGKADLDESLLQMDWVTILPKEKRVNVKWACISQIEATLQLIDTAGTYDRYDYYWLVSGQDILLKPISHIVDFLEKEYKNGINFINIIDSYNFGKGIYGSFDKRNDIYYPSWMNGRQLSRRIIKRLWVEITGGYNKTFAYFQRNSGIVSYFGSQWWCLTNESIECICKEKERFLGFFRNCSCPDESFFQTAFMESPYSELRKDMFLYVDWSEGNNSPNNLTLGDLVGISNTRFLIARKIGNLDDFNKITEWIKNEEKN